MTTYFSNEQKFKVPSGASSLNVYRIVYIGGLQCSPFPLCLSISLRNNIVPTLQVYMIEHDAFERLTKDSCRN